MPLTRKRSNHLPSVQENARIRLQPLLIPKTCRSPSSHSPNQTPRHRPSWTQRRMAGEPCQTGNMDTARPTSRACLTTHNPAKVHFGFGGRLHGIQANNLSESLHTSCTDKRATFCLHKPCTSGFLHTFCTRFSAYNFSQKHTKCLQIQTYRVTS